MHSNRKKKNKFPGQEGMHCVHGHKIMEHMKALLKLSCNRNWIRNLWNFVFYSHDCKSIAKSYGLGSIHPASTHLLPTVLPMGRHQRRNVLQVLILEPGTWQTRIGRHFKLEIELVVRQLGSIPSTTKQPVMEWIRIYKTTPIPKFTGSNFSHNCQRIALGLLIQLMSF